MLSPDVEVLGELGRGGNAVVYRVRRKGAIMALKLLHPGRADEINTQAGMVTTPPTQELTILRREAALMAAVGHPGLPRIYEVGQLGDRPYLILDLVEGRPLSDVLVDGPLRPVQAIRLVMDIGEVLAAMHRTGLVHRDITPHNIMVVGDGGAKLIDFGLAIQLASRDQARVGTLAYTAPEQSGMLTRPVDLRSDLYALGVVLYECVTGEPPFIAEDPVALLRMHAAVTPPELPPELLRACPTIAAIVNKLLAKDPDDRYANDDDLVADLRQLAADPKAVFEPGRRRSPGPDARGPLAGRDGELARLAACWMEARGGNGGVCVVRGESGSGKSRLVAELVAAARADGAFVLSGKSAIDDSRPLAALRRAVDDAVRALATVADETRVVWNAGLRAAAGSAGSLLSDLSPALGDLLGSEPDNPDDAAQRTDQFADAVVKFVVELARATTGGMILHLDDVQWLDCGTREIIARLAAVANEVPLLIVCTGRDDPASGAATDDFRMALGDTISLELTLPPLDERGVADLVVGHFPGIDPAADLIRQLATRTGGNPFVSLEYLRSVIDAGLLWPAWGTWMLDQEKLGALELPGDALSLVLARVDTLTAESRRLLMSAALIGDQFRPDLLATVCGTDLGVSLAALEEAASRHLVTWFPGGRYVFVHDRVREALIDDLASPARRALHRRIADVLAPTVAGASAAEPSDVYAVAHHYMNSDQMNSDQADVIPQVFAACVDAGRLAIAEHAPAAAIPFLEHAAETGNPLDGAFLRLLATALQRDGRYDQAQERLEQALSVEASALDRAAILAQLADVHRATWHDSEAFTAANQALAELGVWVPRNPLLALGLMLGASAKGLFVVATGIGFGTSRARRRERHALISSLHYVCAYAGFTGLRPGLFAVHAMRGLSAGSRLGLSAEYARTLVLAGFAAAVMRLWPLSDWLFRRFQVTAANLNDPRVLAFGQHFQAAAYYMGDRDGGAALIRSLDDNQRWLDPGLVDDGVASICWEAVVEGRTRFARSWYAHALQQRSNDANVADQVSPTSMIAVAAFTLSAVGRAAEAGAELRRARKLVDRHGSVGHRVNLLCAEMVAWHEQGEIGEPFDQTVAEFQSLRIKPLLAFRQYRVFWMHQALGRVAQYGAASKKQKAERRAAAHRAVRQLRLVANTALLRGAARLARAQLHLIEGRPRRCLNTLARIRPLEPDAPLLAFETAQTRARAMAALGHNVEATRQAKYAEAIAVEEGWPHRIRRIRAEFDVQGGFDGSRVVGRASSGTIEHMRLQAVLAVSRAAAQAVDHDSLVRIALDETIRILMADRALLFLFETSTGGDGDPGALSPYLGRDANGQDVQTFVQYSTTLVDQVAATGEPIVVTGTEEGAALGSQSAVIHGLRSILVAPLRLDGQMRGVFYLDSQIAKGVFTAEDLETLTAITDHIGASMETARAAQLEASMQMTRRQRDLAEMLHETLRDMSATLEPDEVLHRLLGHLAKVTSPQDTCLLTSANEGLRALVAARDGAPPRTLTLPDDPALRRLLEAEQPVALTPAELPASIRAYLEPVASAIVLPLATRSARLGTLLLATPDEHAYTEAEIKVATALVGQGAAAYEDATLFAKVQTLAAVDELTGVPNRRRFFDAAERTLAAARGIGQPATAMMIDIDNFKRINDRYGHPTGDDVIRAVADRLATSIRATDILARYGGDEFAVLLPNTELDAGMQVAEWLLAAAGDRPTNTRSGLIPATISIGVAACRFDDDLPTLLAVADNALYDAKQAGRDRAHCAQR
nr:diguanylate cyclase [Asanoa ishikariensis]